MDIQGGSKKADDENVHLLQGFHQIRGGGQEFKSGDIIFVFCSHEKSLLWSFVEKKKYSIEGGSLRIIVRTGYPGTRHIEILMHENLKLARSQNPDFRGSS
jgi:hypothetical protein